MEDVLAALCRAREVEEALVLRREERKVRGRGGGQAHAGIHGETDEPVSRACDSHLASIRTSSFHLARAPQPLREVKERLGRVRAKKGKGGTVSTVADKAFQLLQVREASAAPGRGR